MKLGITFSDTSKVLFNENTLRATPLELLISDGGDVETRKSSLNKYLLAIDYAFRGVKNYASYNIAGVVIEKGWFGRIERFKESIKWDAVSDKNFVVVYDIRSEAITENMYIADGLKYDKVSEEVEPIWLKPLIEPSPNIVKENIIASIAIGAEFLDKHKMMWGFQGVQGVTILDESHTPVLIDDIEDDNDYIICKMLSLLILKGTHMGVFMVDAKGLSDKCLNGLMEMAKLFYGDAFLFYYNVSPDSRVERKTFTLPDFVASNKG